MTYDREEERNMNKSMSLERYEYMKQIIEITNSCKLPSVFKADVLESALRQLRQLADEELKRDQEKYIKESTEGGPANENQRTAAGPEC